MSQPALGKLSGTRQVFIKYITNSQREILALSEHFERENEYHTNRLPTINYKLLKNLTDII